MRIVSIFADKLFAFHYDNEEENELTRLLELWRDTLYIDEFLTENEADIPNNENIDELPYKIIDFADEIDDTLSELANDSSSSLEEFFKPLNNQEYKVVELSRQKGREKYLRLYALKIYDNCFVITGGAIKFTHLMEDRKHTNDELLKINKCKEYLKNNGVFDDDSFFEFINEDI